VFKLSFEVTFKIEQHEKVLCNVMLLPFFLSKGKEIFPPSRNGNEGWKKQKGNC
jgi:hypothetical protein